MNLIRRIGNIIFNLFNKRNRKRKITTLIYLDKMNKNGRIYKKSVVEPHVIEFNNRVSKIGAVYGEIGHPDVFDTSLSRASHVIKDLKICGDEVIGTIETLSTYHGKELRDNFDSYVFRSRGAGYVDEDNCVILEKIFTFDAIPVSEDSWSKK